MSQGQIREIENLLRIGKWKEADQKTTNLISQLTRRPEEDWLRVEDIDSIPCEYLYLINKHWVEYSRDRFGLTVQESIRKRAKERVSIGLTDDIKRMVASFIFIDGFRPKVNAEYILQLEYYFGTEVGWIKEAKFPFITQLTYNEVIYSLNASRGHLPYSLWHYFYSQKKKIPFENLVKNYGVIGSLPKYIYELESRFYTKIKVCCR